MEHAQVEKSSFRVLEKPPSLTLKLNLLLQARPAVCSCVGALRRLGAEKQAGEAAEEAGGAPCSAGEAPSLQKRLRSSSGASALLHRQAGKERLQQEGRSWLHWCSYGANLC